MYAPRSACLLHDPLLVWTIALADALTSAAYASVVVLGAYLWWRAGRAGGLPEHKMPLREIVLVLGFIASCGIGHAIDVVEMWWPMPQIKAVSAAVTSVASWAAVVAIWSRRRLYTRHARAIRTMRRLPELDFDRLRRSAQRLIEEIADAG